MRKAFSFQRKYVMHAVTIHDSRRGKLAFDLSDIVDVLKDRIRDLEWKVHCGVCGGSGGDRLDKAADSDDVLSGPTFLRVLSKVARVIDCDFEGIDPRTKRPALVIRSGDDTYFAVLAKDSRDIDAIRARFKDVREDASELLFPKTEILRAWAKEAERRLKAFERGEMKAIPGEQVLAELFCSPDQQGQEEALSRGATSW